MSVGKILIVEDERIVAKDIQSTLQNLGYEILAMVSSGEEAVSRAAEMRPDLVLMDIMLKGQMDGIQAAQVIQDRFSIPVIYLTAYADSSTLQRAKITTPFGYILKPFEERELHTTIEMALYRHQMDRKFRESEDRFRTLTETATDGIIVIDEESSMLYVNPAVEKIFGYASAEMLGVSLTTLMPDNIRQTHLERMARYIETGGQTLKWESIEFSGLHKSGREIPLELSFSEFTKDGKRYFTGVARDITQRKESEEALWDADRRAIIEYESLLERIASLAQVLGTARDFPVIFRALRDFAKRSTPCSGLFISLFNQESRLRTPVYAWSECVEEDVMNLPPMEMSESPHSRAVATGQTIITDDFQAAVKGQPAVHIGMEINPNLPQSSLVVPMSMMGRIIGAVEVQSTELSAFKQEHATAMNMAANLAAVAVDNMQLLEREQQYKEQLQQSQKMEAVGRLAGGVAHDFNNLLTVITGYSDLSIRHLENDNPIRRNIEEIRKAGERAAALTRQLLAFSRKQVLQPKVLDMNSIIADMKIMMHRLIGEDIDLLTALEPSLGRVKADPNQVEQIILNLAVNARDAMPGGGKITIETANAELDSADVKRHMDVQPGLYVMLAVRDNGCGISQEVQQRIFEPFFTTKEQGKGTGLGLSMVYGIVKQSNGHIWVDSEVGRGTTFKIYLPCIEEALLNSESKAKSGELLYGKETILLVEDDELVRQMASDILKTVGYTILEAQHGGEALSICKQHQEPLDLILTDVVMPQMSGRELAERVALIRPEARVLYMSGYTDDAIVHHGVLDEGTPFLEKPFTPEALARKVREVLDASINAPTVSRET